MSRLVTTEPASGVIDSRAIYPLRLFHQLSGLGKAGVRAARRDGLVVRYVGRVGFVLGADFLDFLSRQSKGR